MKEKKIEPTISSTSEIVFSREEDGVHRNVNGQTLEEWRDQRKERLNSQAWSVGARTTKPNP